MGVMKKEYCGECCWFYAEDTYGNGCCPFEFAEVMKCDGTCRSKGNYASKEDMRHYMAVLLQANRYRRDDNVPSAYKMPNPKEFGKAIDFAYKYIKTFSNL